MSIAARTYANVTIICVVLTALVGSAMVTRAENVRLREGRELELAAAQETIRAQELALSEACACVECAQDAPKKARALELAWQHAFDGERPDDRDLQAYADGVDALECLGRTVTP